MSKALIKAYQITVDDFEKALRATPWWHFRTAWKLANKIEFFQAKLDHEIEYEKQKKWAAKEPKAKRKKSQS